MGRRRSLSQVRRRLLVVATLAASEAGASCCRDACDASGCAAVEANVTCWRSRRACEDLCHGTFCPDGVRRLDTTAAPASSASSASSKKRRRKKRVSRGEVVGAAVTVSLVLLVAIAAAISFLNKKPFFDDETATISYLSQSPLQELTQQP
mmetsp:Transcript_23459/g.75291  ORF Transcript_23459/g.75291 Transcript_23459/m.75291 type:complete len:151 (-) Transcript_23459:744-1196(-)